MRVCPPMGGFGREGVEMAQRTLNVLFLCVGNSARSIMAEALLDRFGRGKFTAFSAGTHPTGEVHPLALELLRHHDFSCERFRSKPWTEFLGPTAPRLDFVISVCERPDDEVWNAWPYNTVKAHWRITDPATVEGSAIERRNAFRHTFRELENRIKLFALLRHEAAEEGVHAA